MPQEEKKHIKTSTGILIILAAAVIIGGGAIAYFYAMSPTSWDYMGQKTAVHKSSNANTNTSNTNSATAGWKTYTNSKYGFDLTLNNAWQGYKWQDIPSTSFETSFIRFDMPTTDTTVKEDTTLGGRYANVFNILVFTPTQWDTVQVAADADTKDLKANTTYINKNSKYVFAYNLNKTLPSDLSGIDFKITDIIKTFQFTQ